MGWASPCWARPAVAQGSTSCKLVGQPLLCPKRWALRYCCRVLLGLGPSSGPRVTLHRHLGPAQASAPQLQALSWKRLVLGGMSSQPCLLQDKGAYRGFLGKKVVVMAAVTVWPGARQGCSESPHISAPPSPEPCLLFGDGLVLSRETAVRREKGPP